MNAAGGVQHVLRRRHGDGHKHRDADETEDQPERVLELAVSCSIRKRIFANRTSSLSDVSVGRFESRYLVGEGRQGFAGLKRQYSGMLGKTGNRQIGVSVHAVGSNGTVPLGWAPYLPEEWCEDAERRNKAKIPEQIRFQTKPELAAQLVKRAAGWEIAKAAILGDFAHGKNTVLREQLNDGELEHVLSVSEEVTVFAPEMVFEVPVPGNAGSGRQKTRLRPDREPSRSAS